MKKNNGISLITLIITVIVIIILASMTIYYGISSNVNKTSDTLSYSEIFEVSEATSQRSLMHRLNSIEYDLVGTPLTDEEPIIVNNQSYGKDWYKLEPISSKELSLENIKRSYIVNYLTGEVISLTPIYVDDEEYYSSNDIQNVVGGLNPTISSNMYDETKGVNRPIIVSGMVPVKNVDGAWIVCSSMDDAWYDYSADNRAWANVMLMDDLSVRGYSNADIRNVTLTELEGLEVVTSGSMFVWVPRYASNSANEVVFSNLLSDCTDPGFVVSSAFEYGSRSLTGIWVSKYDIEYGN